MKIDDLKIYLLIKTAVLCLTKYYQCKFDSCVYIVFSTFALPNIHIISFNSYNHIIIHWLVFNSVDMKGISHIINIQMVTGENPLAMQRGDASVLHPSLFLLTCYVS